MAVTAISERQSPLAAVATLGIANIGAGNEKTIALPPGAVTSGVKVMTSTAFDGTAVTVTVTDGTTAYVTTGDIKPAGETTLARTSQYYPSGGTITISMAQTGTSTVGAAVVIVPYTVVGRATENYG